MTPVAAHAAVRSGIGTVFCHVLENAGVFKQDDEGRAAFLRFAEKVGFQKA